MRAMKMSDKANLLSKFDELEDIVRENTILIKKNRALVSINHDNLHNAYRESYDVTRELLLLQLERARKYIVSSQGKIKIFDYLKKRIEINKKTAKVTEKIISSNELMMEALEESKQVNEDLVLFLEKSLKEQKKYKTRKTELNFSDEEINSLFNLQKENIVNIFRNNSRINQNRKVIQDKIVEVDIISKKVQDLVANFHQMLYKDND